MVWTHRRPLHAIASFSSLKSTLQGGFSDTVDCKAVGAEEFHHFSRTVTAGIKQRQALNKQCFFDVSFSAICTNPLAVIRDIYHYFDLPLSAVAETNMRDYLQRRPRGLYGEHRYRATDFGLQQEQEQRLYGDYLKEFHAFLD